MTPLNVLIVDDSILIQKKMEAALKELGHTVVGFANSGSEALVKYRECNPDLVTMDIVMGEVDGISATKQILAEFPDAKIVMVTSHGQEMMIRDAIKAGAKGYVIKPIKTDVLDRHIQLALG